MGNCIDIQKPVCWADEDEVEDAAGEDQYWPETRIPSRGQRQACRKKKVVAISDETNPVVRSRDDDQGIIGEAAVPMSEIKIKIGKKQLEKLLRQADGDGLPLQQVLLNLVSLEESYRILHDHVDREEGNNWKAKLHSIPEMAE